MVSWVVKVEPWAVSVICLVSKTLLYTRHEGEYEFIFIVFLPVLSLF
jgi:hypothetical protein